MEPTVQFSLPRQEASPPARNDGEFAEFVRTISPASTTGSEINARNLSGESISLTGLSGEIHVKNLSGESISPRNLSGQINKKNKSGESISARNLSGEINKRNNSGESISVRNLSGEISNRNVSLGEISARNFSVGLMRACSMKRIEEEEVLRQAITFRERRFNVEVLPADMLRIYRALEAQFDEEYALLFVFNMQTAMELHRAWNMTLLTSKALQACAQTLDLHMTWNLGVIHLKFFFEDGQYELQRKVPYDYDSEFQDLFMKISSAVYNGRLTVHEALLFQEESKQGVHTAKSGLFLRTYPGRLILQPAMASTCSMIFFGGDLRDAGVAALCGLLAGLVDWGTGRIGGEAGMLCDIFVGVLSGVIGALFYRYDGEQYCLSAIFLGTMYWFFYGTAFVVGLVEILAGELETGVTRFMAVCIKTFVLCVSACCGLVLALPNPAEVWYAQAEQCNTMDLGEQWWRIPLYIANSMAVLGQYRFHHQGYWRGLLVQLAGYEVQFQVSAFFARRRELALVLRVVSDNNLGVMTSNICGACAAVLTAGTVSFVVDAVNRKFYDQLLLRAEHRDETASVVDNTIYRGTYVLVKFFNWIGVGRGFEDEVLSLEKKIYEAVTELDDPLHPRREITLEAREEVLLLDTIVFAEPMNIWSMLMPAVYQLVPGGLIARMWFDIIIPPDDAPSSVFAGLMVTSISLALGLIIGDAIAVITVSLVQSCMVVNDSEDFAPQDNEDNERDLEKGRGLMTCSVGPKQDMPRISEEDSPKSEGARCKVRKDMLMADPSKHKSPNDAVTQDQIPKVSTDQAENAASSGEVSKGKATSMQSQQCHAVDASAGLPADTFVTI